VSWKLHGNCTEFFTDLQKIPIWGGSNGFLPHFYRCWMSGFSPLFTAVLTAVYSGWYIPFFRPRAFRQIEIAPILVLIAESRFSPYKVITKTLTEVSAFLVQFLSTKKSL
jgi:hypothetical protein